MSKHIPLILVAAILSVTGEIALKIAMNRFGTLSVSPKDLPQTVWNLMTNPLVLLALFLYVIAVFFWIAALSRMDLNFAYPVFTALGYIMATIASRLILSEPLPPSRLTGIAIICVGLLVIWRYAD